MLYASIMNFHNHHQETTKNLPDGGCEIHYREGERDTNGHALPINRETTNYFTEFGY
jgi:hypothetical protein